MAIAGITVHPNEPWMKQMARNVTMEGCGILRDCRYLLHDRDTKYTRSFRAIIVSGRVEPLALPARSPNLNAYAERWVRSVEQECLSKVILFGERSLRRALNEYVEHYHAERNHQGKSNVLLFRRDTDPSGAGLFNVGTDSAGSCVFTIKRLHDRTPKDQSRNFDFARCDWEIEEVAEAALLPVAPTRRSRARAILSAGPSGCGFGGLIFVPRQQLSDPPCQ